MMMALLTRTVHQLILPTLILKNQRIVCILSKIQKLFSILAKANRPNKTSKKRNYNNWLILDLPSDIFSTLLNLLHLIHHLNNHRFSETQMFMLLEELEKHVLLLEGTILCAL